MRKITDAELAHVYGAWSIMRPIHRPHHKHSNKHSVKRTVKHTKHTVKHTNMRPVKW